MSLKRLGLIFASVLACVGVARGQTGAPNSGEITVQLVQGIDSAVNPHGKSEGRVTKSTNPVVPVGSAALLGLSSDPVNGGYTVKLMRLGINGQMVPAASSDVALAPDFLNKMLERTRAKGQPQDAVSGTRVFLPEKMIVRMTLAQPPAETAVERPDTGSTAGKTVGAVRPAAAPPVWRMLSTDTSDPNSNAHSVAIAGTAEAGGRHGPAALKLGCTYGHYANSTEQHASLPVSLRVPTSMAAFMSKPGYGDFTCEGDGATGSFSVYTEVGGRSVPARSACFDGEKPTNPTAPIEFGLGYEDAVVKQIATSQGGELLVHFREKAGSPDDLVARFPLPEQAPAVQQMIAPCLDLFAAQHKKERESVVVECPALEGEILSDVAVLTGSAMKQLAPDGDNDIGIVWDMPRVTKAHPVRPKLTLACSYKNDAGVPDKKMLPIPTTAVRCARREDDFTNALYGRCLNHTF